MSPDEIIEKWKKDIANPEEIARQKVLKKLEAEGWITVKKGEYNGAHEKEKTTS